MNKDNIVSKVRKHRHYFKTDWIEDVSGRLKPVIRPCRCGYIPEQNKENSSK